MINTPQCEAVPLRFDVYELHPSSGELHKYGSKIKIQGQPLQILRVLLQNAGQVVPRNQLYRELWPSGTYVDFDRSINAAVKRLREALHDSAMTPRFIETVPRCGYRFVYPLGNQEKSPDRTLPPSCRPGASRTLIGLEQQDAIDLRTVARHFRVSPDLLRLYEREGLLIPLRFRSSRRYFTSQDYRWITTLLQMLRKGGLNFAGIRRLLALLPCWQIRGCEHHRKQGCPFIKDSLEPCWMNKQSCCSDGQTCYTCPVYRSAPECQNLKPLLARHP